MERLRQVSETNREHTEAANVYTETARLATSPQKRKPRPLEAAASQVLASMGVEEDDDEPPAWTPAPPRLERKLRAADVFRILSSSVGTMWEPKNESPSGPPDSLVYPKRCSHRVGPPGRRGSEATTTGEGLWAPPIARMRDVELNPVVLTLVSSDDERLLGPRPSGGGKTQDDDATTAPSMAATPKRTRPKVCSVSVTFAPGNKRNVYNFGPGVHPDPKRSRDVAVHAWKHTPGCSMCKALGMPHYESDGDGGALWHVRMKSDVPCEVLDPGAAPPPRIPRRLARFLLVADPSSSPVAPPPPPLAPLPPLPPPPQSGSARYLPAVPEFNALVGERALPPPTELPGVPISFACREAPKLTADDEAPVWTLEKSIFGGRKKGNDSRAFCNTERMYNKALDLDFKRIAKLSRTHSIMADKAIVKTTKETFRKYVVVLCCCCCCCCWCCCWCCWCCWCCCWC